ncbi:MAG: CHAT domain-containing protein, partial [Micrococcales bacterium]|nr:CHAT domain-containing protein [Micrococcales bacterium]
LMTRDGKLGVGAGNTAVSATVNAARILLELDSYADVETRLLAIRPIEEHLVAHRSYDLDISISMHNVWTVLALLTGSHDDAHHQAEHVVELIGDQGWEPLLDPTILLEAYANLAATCLATHDLTRARELFTRVLAAPAGLTPHAERAARLGLARVTMAHDPQAAIPELTALLDTFADNREGFAHVAIELGRIAQASGDLATARRWYVTASEGAEVRIDTWCLALLATTWTHVKPDIAQMLRACAREAARETAPNIVAMVDYVTAADALSAGFDPQSWDLALAAALVMDVGRMDLPEWVAHHTADAVPATLLASAHTRGHHDIVAAVAAHLGAVVLDDSGAISSLPARTLVAGVDVLAQAANSAVERYGYMVRDESRTADVYTNTDGLDLVAVERGEVYLCWRRPTGTVHSVRVARAALMVDEESPLPGLGEHLLPPELVADVLASGRVRIRAAGNLAQIPWPVLVVPGAPGDARLGELVDVVLLDPFGLVVDGPADQHPWTTTRGPDDLERELGALERALCTAQHDPAPPPSVAAVAQVEARCATVDEPAATVLRLRTLDLRAGIAWLADDTAEVRAVHAQIAELCTSVMDAGGPVAAEAASFAVGMHVDAALLHLGEDMHAARQHLRAAEAICSAWPVPPVHVLCRLVVQTRYESACARVGAALRCAETAVELGRQVGTVMAWGYDVGAESYLSAVNELALACRSLGDFARAVALYEQVLAHPARTTGQDRDARLGQAVATTFIDGERGVPMLLDIVAWAQRMHDAGLLAYASAILGSMARVNGQLDVARHWYTLVTQAGPDQEGLTGSGYVLLARTWAQNPTMAAQLRDMARRTVQALSTEVRVQFDFMTGRDALEQGFAHDEVDRLLPACLVMDVWRIDVPEMLRGPWQDTELTGGTGMLLQLATERGDHDLAAALAAHLAATIPPAVPPGADDRWLPPRVLVAGTDPLAPTAAAAVERYSRAIRDEQRTFDAYTNTSGLDLVAVARADIYLCWRRPTTGAVHSVRVERSAVEAALTELAVAANAALVPPGTSALLDPDSEVALMTGLGKHLLPPELVTDLRHIATHNAEAVAGAGGTVGTESTPGLRTPRLRVRADGDLAQVPWGLLVVPGAARGPSVDTRLVELVDLVTLAPFGLPVRAPHTEDDAHRNPAPETAGLDPTDHTVTPSPDQVPHPAHPTDHTVTDPASGTPPGAVVAVLDPRVPGFPTDSALGSVLGRMPAGTALEQRMRAYLADGRLVAQPPLPSVRPDAPAPGGPNESPESLFRRRDQDRTWLTAALAAGPARLLFVGHVSTVALADGTYEPALHLCCPAETPGHAAPLGAHRPLAASDILADDMRYPPRVALVACASGDDARTRDAYGLAHSLLSQGATIVTGMLWPLPTGHWYAHAHPHDTPGENPLVTLTLAVDDAHESPDPVGVLATYQRTCLARWRSTGDLVDSPISWGGLHTIISADER